MFLVLFPRMVLLADVSALSKFLSFEVSFCKSFVTGTVRSRWNDVTCTMCHMQPLVSRVMKERQSGLEGGEEHPSELPSWSLLTVQHPSTLHRGREELITTWGV